ncbi:FAD-dependent monooxygenase [Actinomadura luteofluorescens]|uniref:FAD-dependent monooxygenase n=1 Tax=Actinomadura luteofluorescens TaxID=46163 RepID=UPI003477D273
MDAGVIVVGAGPVGLMLAGELRLGGADVVVLERRDAPAAESRASTLHARTMEIFDGRGLLERVGAPPRQPMGHFGGVPLDMAALPSRYPGQWKVPQTRVEEVLAEWAAGLGADVRRGHEVTDLAVADDRVKVRAAGPGGPLELTAAYVVGCDGEDSGVRRLAGIPFPGRDATRELLRADVAGLRIRDRRFERLPGGLAIAGRLPGGATRVMVGEYAPAAPRTAPATFEELCRRWRRVTGEDIGGGTPLWVNAFGDAARLAERYRSGRVMLAGDAAHLQMPAGGQAINLGLQDAVNLGWKLAAVATGRAPDGLLDTYHQERHEVGRRILRNVDAQSALLLGGDVGPVRTVLAELIVLPEVRDLLAGTIGGLDVRYERGAHPLVGARMPHVPLETASGRTDTTVLLRSGRGLLLDLSADTSRAARLGDLLSGCAGRVALVPAAPQREGPIGGLDTVLVRPDGYVAWVGTRSQDPGSALRRWFGSRRRRESPC